MDKQRVEWVDIAKGISILLVVLWHSKVKGDGPLIDLINTLNEGLIFLRMPLFFFVSGFFIHKSLCSDWSFFLKYKIVNLLYLFILWSIINDFIFKTTPIFFRTNDVVFTNPISYFIDPPATLWFIYALALGFIVVKLTRQLPMWINVLFYLTMYAVSASDGQWRHVEFIYRLGRLIPFLYLGSITFKYVSKLIPRLYLYFLPGIVILPIGYMSLMGSNLVSNPIITFIASSLGLFVLLSFSYAIEGSFAGKIFKLTGANSLYIYVMHRIPLTLSIAVLSKTILMTYPVVVF